MAIGPIAYGFTGEKDLLKDAARISLIPTGAMMMRLLAPANLRSISSGCGNCYLDVVLNRLLVLLLRAATLLVHAILTSAFGFLVYCRVDTFGGAAFLPGCIPNSQVLFDMFGRHISATNLGLRGFALFVFSCIAFSCLDLWNALVTLLLLLLGTKTEPEHVLNTGRHGAEEISSTFDMESPPQGPSTLRPLKAQASLWRVQLAKWLAVLRFDIPDGPLSSIRRGMLAGIFSVGLGFIVYLIGTIESTIVANSLSSKVALNQLTFGQAMPIMLLMQQGLGAAEGVAKIGRRLSHDNGQ